MMRSAETYEQKLDRLREEKQDSPIMKYHNENSLRLSNFVSQNDQIVLKDRLLSIAYSLGIPNAPTEEYLNSLIVFLQRNYGNDITSLELVYSFELYMTEKLDVKKRPQQTFNMDFIGSVLNAYMKYRAGSLDREKKEREKDTIQEITWLESGKRMHDVIMEFMKQTGRVPVVAHWEAAYDYLVSEGLIDMTKEEKKEYKEKYKATRIAALQKKMNMLMTDQQEYREHLAELNDEKKLQWLCRRQCAIDFYKVELKLLNT